MQTSATLAGALARFLNEEGIEYCVLGHAARGRTGLVVSGATLPRMPALLRAFGVRHELELIQHARQPDRVERYVLGGLGRELWTIDVRADYQRCGHLVFTAEELLRARLPPAEGARDDQPYYRAAPAKDFICHLFHCLARGEILEEDRVHLSELWQLDPPGVAMQVERFWNAEREGGMILRVAAAGNWEAVHAATRALTAALPMRRTARLRSWFHAASVRLQCWLRPQGLLIGCLGPAGSGKSTVIEALCQARPAPFREVHTMELRPGLMRPGSIKTGVATRERQPRGQLATLAKLAMFVLDYWLGYWLRIRPQLARSTLVLSERYFDDVLVDPRRYRMRRPRAVARLLLRWIPRPHLWLVLDITSQALEARQAHLPTEEAARQRAEYRRLLRGHENVVFIDADQSPARVLAQAERAILAQLGRQTAQRLGLPLETRTNPLAASLLLFFCRRHVPLVSHMVRVLFNSDIQARLAPDVYLPHPYGIVVHPQAAIGRRVTLMQQVSIGGKSHDHDIAPVIGDDVYIGAGAKILGDVRVGQGAIVGANAVVTRDVPPGATVVGANRIVLPVRSASDSSVTRLPVGNQRGVRTQVR